MEILLSLFLSLMAVGAAWMAARYLESRKQLSRLRDLESKYRYAQGEGLKLQEEVTGLKSELGILQKILETERTSKTTLVTQLTQAFKRSLFVFSAGYLSFGLLLGGGAGWMVTSAKLEARSRSEKAVLETDLALYRFKNKLNVQKNRQLENQMDRLRRTLENERIEKTIALTKLGILLGSLSPQRGAEGFGIDFSKLKTILPKDQTESKALSRLPMLSPAKQI